VLYFSLVLSGVLLLITNLIAWKAEYPVATVLVTSALFFLASFGLLGIRLPPILFQATLLGAIVSVWGLRRWRRSVFLALSCAATLLVYGAFGAVAFQETRQLQREFPYVSMEDRLPLPKTRRPVASLPLAPSDRLDSLEILPDNHNGRNDDKVSALRAIHEDAVRVFVNQPAFGVTRMRMTFAFYFLRNGARREPPISQPGHPSPSPWLLDSFPIGPDSSKDDDGLLSLHQGSVVDFANADNFGFMKDRRHVAGFQEHQISQTPTPSEPWTLQTVDLIGVALHEEPVAYVSEYLPRMDELRAAPTRSLDDFESAGLTALERGEELFVRDRGGERRMLGAIRAARQCLACHGGERGDLLGAFSYRLTQDRK
jgi:hypothetical protein